MSNSFHRNYYRGDDMDEKLKMELLYLTKRAHPVFQKRMEPLAKTIGLTPQEGQILLFLANHPNFSHACDAVMYRGLSKSYVSKALASLLKKGYILFQEDGRDRRYQKIILTKDAKAKVRVLQTGQKALFQELIEGLPKEDLDTCKSVLHQMFQNFTKIEEDMNV